MDLLEFFVKLGILTYFGSEKYDTICNKSRYLISLKSSIEYAFSHYYIKIKVDWYGSLFIEKKIYSV